MSLFSALTSTSETMRAFERGLETTQNNVSNASTPGFAKQTQTFFAKPFDPSVGILGGVTAGPLADSRNRFAEEAVWLQQHQASSSSQRRADLESIEPVFSVQDGAGIAAALDRLFQSFSQLSVSPNDATTRQTALERAKDVASNFNQNAANLNLASQNTDRQAKGVVDQINQIGARIAKLNAARRSTFAAGVDPGADAALHQTLEELAGLVDYKAIENDDGTLSIYLGGQTLFVIGNRHYDISLDLSSGSAQILDASGQAITSQLTGGKLTSLVGFRNTVLPSYMNSVNTLAASVADQINTTLAGGLDQTGAAPTVNLFNYVAAQGAAATLTVNNLQPSDLALASPAAPGGNGNALNLAALSTQTLVSGQTFNGYYSDLAARVGRDLTAARQSEQTNGQLLDQAKSLRQDISGVSLDEEAAQMLQFQRSYQAAAQMFRIVNEMTDSLINMAS